MSRLRALDAQREAINDAIVDLIREAGSEAIDIPLHVSRLYRGEPNNSAGAQARRAVETRVGNIYVAQVDGGLLKIGFSHNPSRRMSEIKTNYSLGAVDLLGSVPGRVSTERRLHNAVRSHAAFDFRRPSKEFYHPTDFMKSTVAWLMGLGKDADTFVRHFIQPLKEKAQDTSPLPYWTAKRAQRGAVQ